MGGVLASVEVEDKEIAPITLELLSIGRRLAGGLDEDLSAAIIGGNLDGIPKKVAQHADKVYVVEDTKLEGFRPELHVSALEKLCNQVEPAILLIGHTSKGSDIAPRLSYRLKTVLTTDCLELEIDSESGLLKRTKQVYGGNAIATFVCESRPQLVTLRPKVVEPVTEGSTSGEVIQLDFEVDESRSKVEPVERVEEEIVRLDDADAVVSGGRGIEEAEGFEELKALTELLGNSFRKVELGSSRPPVDLGWISSSRQVGLTGEKVSPELYIAVGISGATQHLVGMSNSKTVVAINTDPNATIFDVSDYGVVGDYKEILPSFKKKLGEIL